MTAFWVGALLAVTTVVWARVRRERARFRRVFPPITDAEFLSRCGQNVSPDVALKVRRIVAKHLAVDYDRVYPSSRFIDDLGAD